MRWGIVYTFGNDVAGHKISALTVFFFHEIYLALIFNIVKSSSLTASRLGNQHTLLRSFDCSGMILNKFQIFKTSALLVKLGGNVAVALHRARGFAEQNVLSATCNHYRICINGFYFTLLVVIEQRTVALVVLYQSGMELSAKKTVYYVLTFVFSCLADKCAHNLLSCRSTRISGAVFTLTAKGTKSNLAFFVPGKYNSEGFKLLDYVGSCGAKTVNRHFRCNITTAFQGVKRVLTYGVIRADCRVDSTCRHNGLGSLGRIGRNQGGTNSVFCELNSAA